LHLLYLEDNAADADLVRAILLKEWPACRIDRVDTRRDFVRALESTTFDAILSDYSLPGFDGLSALVLARAMQPTVPYIFVSGTIGEETAVEALKNGAVDYVIKDRLTRLVPALRRARADKDAQEQRHLMEARLRDSQERFQELAEQSSEIFWFVGLTPERIHYLSPAIERIWGQPAEAFYNDPRSWLASIHPGDEPRVRAAYEACLAGASTRYEQEYRVVQPDGSERWVLDTRTVIRDSAGRPTRLSGIAKDVTDRKQAEELMQRAQRLENLGMLVAGIAHDFNNALAPIVMAGPLLRLQPIDPAGMRILETVEQCSARGADLVRRMLSFARGSSGTNQVVNIRPVLREVLGLAEATFPKSIKLVPNLPDDSWAIQGNPTQIYQIFLNLCVNARDAMPNGGQLSLTATNRRLDAAAAAAIADGQAGSFLAVEVRDSGTGIAPEALGRIWEPFFTTKGEGKGTGLGLSTARGIVQNCGGFVTVQSRVGQGTAFTVFLPALTAADGGRHPAKAHSMNSLRGNNELVLVVDDEDSVREIASRTLTSHGYRTLLARDGADAIAVFAPRAAEVKLLLTDLQMPMLDGATLATALRRLNPHLPVVAMSGASSSQHAGRPGFTGTFLAKPFRSETLLSIVQSAIAQATAAAPPPPT
jgi:two-component system cell cycle sensor histidine kinase/response regulator CckA